MFISKIHVYATLIVLAIFLSGAGYIVVNQKSLSEQQSSSETTPEAFYTLAEVAKHDGAENCWVAVAGKVYDVTSWIARHPGGEKAVLSICGIDGTQSFQGQHGGDPQPQAMLASFEIGVLKE